MARKGPKGPGYNKWKMNTEFDGSLNRASVSAESIRDFLKEINTDIETVNTKSEKWSIGFKKINQDMATTLESLAKSGKLTQDVVDNAKGLRDETKSVSDVLEVINQKYQDQSEAQENLMNLEAELLEARATGNDQRISHIQTAIDLEKENLDTLGLELDALSHMGNGYAVNELAQKGLSMAMDGFLGQFPGLIAAQQAFNAAAAANPYVAIIMVAIALSQVLQSVVDKIKEGIEKWSGKMDDIGDAFGAIGLQSEEIKNNIIGQEAEAIRLGYAMSDVVDVSQTLTDNFSIGLTESLEMTGQVLDMTKALGLSVEEGSKLVGTFKDMAGLTTQQSIDMAKNITLFAKANNVAPKQVLQDIADSSANIAMWTDETGDNIARGAVQAAKLGQEIDDVAESMKGMLDYQTALSNQLEASVLTGKQFNIQKLQELSMAGDLEGFQQEQLKLLREVGYAELDNVLAREAAAKALGLTVEQAQRMVTATDEAVGLAGDLAGQPGFDDLVGKEAMSNLTQMKQQFAAISAQLLNVLGPIITGLMSTISVFLNTFMLVWEGTGIGMLLRGFTGGGWDYRGGDAAVTLGKSVGIPMATGGIVTEPTNAVVGEAGPEAVVPLDKFMAEFRALKSEMAGVKDAITSLRLKTEITNKQLNVVLTPELG